MTQPPLSEQIRQLEAEIGVRLLNRTKRSVELTEAGKTFLEQARRLVEDAEAALRAAHRSQNGEIGQLVLTFSADVTYAFLPQVLSTHRHELPDVSLTLEEMASADQVTALLSRRSDVALLHPPIDASELSLAVVRAESLVLALPHGHRLLGSAQIRLSDLDGERVVRYRRRAAPARLDALWSAVSASGAHVRVEQEAMQPLTIIGLVAAGVGIAIFPGSVRMLQRSGVVYRDISGPVPTHFTAIAWRTADERPVLRSFIDLVKSLSPGGSEATAARGVERSAGVESG